VPAGPALCHFFLRNTVSLPGRYRRLLASRHEKASTDGNRGRKWPGDNPQEYNRQRFCCYSRMLSRL